MFPYQNEKGFTLTEILASIVILFIALVSFYSFFAQSSVFTKKNEESLIGESLVNQTIYTLRSKNLNATEWELPNTKALLGVNSQNQFVKNPSLSLKLTLLDSGSDGQLQKVKVEILDKVKTTISYSYCFLEQGE